MVNLGLGLFLIAAGAVSGLAAAFSVSKRALLVVIALTLIVSGAYLANANTQIVHHEAVVAKETLAVPGGGCVNESIQYNATGYYALELKDNGESMNSTVLSTEEFTQFRQGQLEPNWRYWRGMQDFSGTLYGDGDSSNHVVLVLSNPQAADRQVAVQIYRGWDEYNYLALIGGALLIVAGVFAFYFANRRQIASFNRALESVSEQ